MTPGANYGEAIIRAIDGTRVTLLLLSAQANSSDLFHARWNGPSVKASGRSPFAWRT